MAVQLDELASMPELPRYLTRFTGRERELVELSTLLGRTHERLVTLIGPGGVGKTRLMVEALDRWADESPAVPMVFVDGTALDEAEQLMPEIANRLNLEQQGDETIGGQISEYLADRSALVILDNMEHLLAASLEVAALLRACPGLRIFATSRAPLRISSERLISLEPLPTVAANEEGSSPAADLFIDRAMLARPAFGEGEPGLATVEAICERLDGLPLAIELAAARLRLLSPEALLALLTRQLTVLGGGAVDIAPRHQTLHAAIAWSFELLSEPEQRIFQQLGIFPESFSLESVEAVCFAELPEAERAGLALDRLTSLFDLGLLQPVGLDDSDQMRFRMLVSIREFARDLLVQTGELEAMSDRLTSAVAAFVDKHREELTGPRQADSMAALASESVAIRLVLDRAIERGDIETSLGLIAGLWRFWVNRGLFHDARAVIDRAFAGQTIETTLLWGMALRGGAVIAELQSDWDAARAWGEAALRIWTELGDVARMATSWIDSGNVHSTAGALDEARVAFERATSLAGEAGDRRLEFIATSSLANVALRQGRLEEAVEGYEAAVPIARRTGDQWMLATLLSNFGVVLVRVEQRSQAKRALQEALMLYRELGDEAGMASALTNLDEASGDDSIGGDFAREALDVATRLDAPYLIGPAQLHLGVGALRDGRPQAAGDHLALALRNFQLADNPIFSCEVIELIAELLERTEPDMAAQLLGGTAAFRFAGGIEWHGYHAPRARALELRLRKGLGEIAFQEHWSIGGALELHELIVDALTAAYRVAHSTARPLANRVDTSGLTAREMIVLRLLADGKSDREIGSELFISPKTVNRHVSSILAKLECRNRTAATAVALQLGLI